MQYFGGKCRIAKQIAGLINEQRPSQYYEPFCGGLWVSQYVQAGTLHLSDVSQPLITLYQALWDGWVPPSVVSEGDYKHYQDKQDYADPMTGFVGYGCSFAGKYFGGYARCSTRNYALNAKNSLARKFKALRNKNVVFSTGDYSKVLPNSHRAIIYCDPPYQGTTSYAICPDFHWLGFWAWVKERSRMATVYTSSYEAPHGFQTVLRIPTKTDIRTKSGRQTRCEQVFTWKEDECA